VLFSRRSQRGNLRFLSRLVTALSGCGVKMPPTSPSHERRRTCRRGLFRRHPRLILQRRLEIRFGNVGEFLPERGLNFSNPKVVECRRNGIVVGPFLGSRPLFANSPLPVSCGLTRPPSVRRGCGALCQTLTRTIECISDQRTQAGCGSKPSIPFVLFSGRLLPRGSCRTSTCFRRAVRCAAMR
jgi:hypothetical protein